MKNLFLIVNLVLFSANASASEVHFNTKDNATIYAHFQQRGSHAVLLAHGAVENGHKS